MFNKKIESRVGVRDMLAEELHNSVSKKSKNWKVYSKF